MAIPHASRTTGLEENAFDNFCYDLQYEAMESGGLNAIATSVRTFLEAHSSDRLWRRPEVSVAELAVAELSRQAVVGALTHFGETEDWIGTKSQVFAIAELVILEIEDPIEPEIHSYSGFTGVQLKYDALRRRLVMLAAMRQAGAVLPNVVKGFYSRAPNEGNPAQQS
jgi:hypothetical protein